MICDKMRTTRILPLAATTSRVVVLTNLGAEANIRPRQRLPRWREPVPRRCGGFSSVTACGRIGFALSCSSTNPNSLRSHRTVFQREGETLTVNWLKTSRWRVYLPAGRHPDRHQLGSTPRRGFYTIYQSVGWNLEGCRFGAGTTGFSQEGRVVPERATGSSKGVVRTGPTVRILPAPPLRAKSLRNFNKLGRTREIYPQTNPRPCCRCGWTCIDHPGRFSSVNHAIPTAHDREAHTGEARRWS